MAKELEKKNNPETIENTVSIEMPKRFVYCGPNLPGGMLQRYTVYKGGLPAHIEEIIKDCPEMKILMVEPAGLQKMRQDVETPGTAAQIAYSTVADFIKNGGVK